VEGAAMSPAAEALAARITGARAAFELNEVAADAAHAGLSAADRVRLQELFADRCRELWPELVRPWRFG
jgi:hypothetical protein